MKSMTAKLLFGAIGVTFIAPVAVSGTVVQANWKVEPQMNTEVGEIKGCGIRLNAVPNITAATTRTTVIDVSVHVYRDGFALVKGGASDVAVVNLQPASPSPRVVQSLWMRSDNQPNPISSAGATRIPTDPEGYILFESNFDLAFMLYTALFEDRPIHVGMRLDNDPVDLIYTGQSVLDQFTKDELMGCISAMASAMERDLTPR